MIRVKLLDNTQINPDEWPLLAHITSPNQEDWYALVEPNHPYPTWVQDPEIEMFAVYVESGDAE